MRDEARSRLRRLPRVVALLLLAALLAGCLLPPEPATPTARIVWDLYLIVFAMGAAVFVAVEGFILYSVVRYRRVDDRLPTQHHGNQLVELIWTAIPTVIVLVMFVVSMLALGSVEARVPNPYLTVEVTGFQWQWTFRYLDADDDPSNDYSVTGAPGAPPVLTVPVGEPVRLILRSPDVIHSFFVRNFLIKRDVIPAGPERPTNDLEFTVSQAGTYSGQCAEFCGDLHAEMTFSVEALPVADFDTWLANAQSGATPTPGPTASPGATVVQLASTNSTFDLHELTVPAGEAFVLEFTNNDSVPHNVSISAGGEVVFTGDLITGPTTISYQVPALEAGEYTFICDVHPVPAMTGTLTVE